MYKIPDHMIESIQRYVENGIKPGSFLKAIITNNLKEAIGRADHINIHLIPEYVKYFYNEVPSNCWGNEDNYKSWKGIKNAR